MASLRLEGAGTGGLLEGSEWRRSEEEDVVVFGLLLDEHGRKEIGWAG